MNLSSCHLVHCCRHFHSNMCIQVWGQNLWWKVKLSKVIAIVRTKFIPSSWQVLIVKWYPDEHYPRNVHGRLCWQFICSRMSTITTRQHSTTKQHHDQLQFTVNRQCKYTDLRSLAGWTAYPRGRQPEEDIYSCSLRSKGPEGPLVKKKGTLVDIYIVLCCLQTRSGRRFVTACQR